MKKYHYQTIQLMHCGWTWVLFQLPKEKEAFTGGHLPQVHCPVCGEKTLSTLINTGVTVHGYEPDAA